jgi:hypothetical protein
VTASLAFEGVARQPFPDIANTLGRNVMEICKRLLETAPSKLLAHNHRTIVMNPNESTFRTQTQRHQQTFDWLYGNLALMQKRSNIETESRGITAKRSPFMRFLRKPGSTA